MPYSAEELDQIDEARTNWSDRQDALVTAFLLKSYTTQAAKEFASHGLSRRLSTLVHCLDRTFECVPPAQQKPSRLELLDASAFIQAFIINVFGAIDNLARIWCIEANVRDGRGRIISPSHVGLASKNKTVRSSLSASFQTRLADYDGWFDYLESYRHSLAHRVPLYIPPQQLSPACEAEFQALEEQKAIAFTARDWARVGQLSAAQDRLGTFEPYIMHSFSERVAPVRFHRQMVCDLATVVEIGEHMLSELEVSAKDQ